MKLIDIFENHTHKGTQPLIKESITFHHGGRAVKDLRVDSVVKMALKGSVRGLVHGRNIWWWPAQAGTHGDVARMLGFEDYVNHRLIIYKQNGELRLDGVPVDIQNWHKYVSECPQLVKLTQSDQLYFYAGSHGWLPGPEFLQLASDSHVSEAWKKTYNSLNTEVTEAEQNQDVHSLTTDQLEKLMKANNSYSFHIPRRKLKIANLIQKDVIFVTYPHDESGWDTHDNKDWSYSLITLYNIHQGGWTAEAKKYKKPLSYAHAARTINTSQPNLGDQRLVYDNKYLQILWSVKKLGLPDQLVYENPSAEPSIEEAWSKKYKKSINCNNPKGFSQRAHCAGRKARQAHKSTQSKSVSENNVTPSRSNISQQLRQWEEMDQKPRNEYQKFVQTKFGGNYNNARSTWMAQKGTSEEDFFGTAEKEKQVHNQLLTMLPQIPFDTLTKEDWDNLWLITQHADQLPELQKRVLNKLKQYVHVGDNRSHSEYLTDRLLKNQGKPQKYFTQMSEGTQALTAFQQSRCNHKR